MINGKTVIAFTPARGQSKSVPYKNLHVLGGRPLLAWPIETAQLTPEVDRVLVSTDDERIAAVARELGAEIHQRPAELASDTSQVIDAIRHFREELREAGATVDIMVLLEATSPFRAPGLVSRCLARLVSENLDSIATFHAASTNPERTWRVENGKPRPFIEGAIPWKPRQQLTPAFELNGAVYAFRLDRLPDDGPSILFGQIGAEVIPGEDVIDIDDQRDFVIADAILRSRKRL